MMHLLTQPSFSSFKNALQNNDGSNIVDEPRQVLLCGDRFLQHGLLRNDLWYSSLSVGALPGDNDWTLALFFNLDALRMSWERPEHGSDDIVERAKKAAIYILDSQPTLHERFLNSPVLAASHLYVHSPVMPHKNKSCSDVAQALTRWEGKDTGKTVLDVMKLIPCRMLSDVRQRGST